METEKKVVAMIDVLSGAGLDANEYVEGDLDLHRVKTQKYASRLSNILVMHCTYYIPEALGDKRGIRSAATGSDRCIVVRIAMCVGVNGEPLGLARAVAHPGWIQSMGKHAGVASQKPPDIELERWNNALRTIDRVLSPRPDAASTNITDSDLAAAGIASASIGNEVAQQRVVHVKQGDEHGTALMVEMYAQNREFLVRIDVKAPKLDSASTKASHGAGMRGRTRATRRTMQRKKQAKSTTESIRIGYTEAVIQVNKEAYPGVLGGEIPLGVVFFHSLDEPDSPRSPKSPKSPKSESVSLMTNRLVPTERELRFAFDAFMLHRAVCDDLFAAFMRVSEYEEAFAAAMPEWDSDRIYNVLRMFLPTAAAMVRLRWFYRARSDADATEVLDNDGINVLRSYDNGGALSERPTVREVVRHMCRLSGHDPDRSEPDWDVLGMGYLGTLALAAHRKANADRESAKSAGAGGESAVSSADSLDGDDIN